MAFAGTQEQNRAVGFSDGYHNKVAPGHHRQDYEASFADLFITPNYGIASNNNRRQQQYAKCSLCQGFANIYCVNCNNAWLCNDHWRDHRDIKHVETITL